MWITNTLSSRGAGVVRVVDSEMPGHGVRTHSSLWQQLEIVESSDQKLYLPKVVHAKLGMPYLLYILSNSLPY